MDVHETNTETKSRGSRPVILAILGAALLVSLGLAIGLGVGLRSLKPQTIETISTTAVPSTRKSKTGSYRFAAVASDADVCSDIGTKILAVQQGSAVDAAIATMLCIGVIHRHSCGIGGGFFMTIYNRTTRTADVLDARERAPLAANETFFVGRAKDASTFGGLAIGVPGDIMGHWTAHQKYGRLPWRKLLIPTIQLCKRGITLRASIHGAIKQYAEVLKNMSYPEYFHPETGEIMKVGDLVRYPRLARTLEVIAEEGASAFYNGSLTDHIVNDVQDHGGVITREDLNLYTATWRTPLSVSLTNNLTVYSVPPPGSGAVLEYILNILDGYGFTPDGLSTNEKSVLTYHRIIEAMKFAYAKRSSLGDESFVDVKELIANMTSNDFGNAIRSMITDDHTHDTSYYGPTFYDQEKTGTSHTSVMDAQGNAVAITATINTFFGSKVKGSRTGIVFNNEMDDFSTPGLVNFYGVPASEANFIQPRKRPLSAMSPSIIVNGTSGHVILTVGASGGTRITTAAALVTMYTLWLGLPVSVAVDHDRIHHQLLPPVTRMGKGFSQAIKDGLKAKGHNISHPVDGSIVNPIHVHDRLLYAVSDHRKGGAPSGY